MKIGAYINFVALSKEVGRLTPCPACLQSVHPTHTIDTMTRVLMLKLLFNLSHEQIEYQLLDRISFQRFCGLAREPNIPDRTTICAFENDIEEAGAKVLFDKIMGQLVRNGFITQSGQFIGAGLSKCKFCDETSGLEWHHILPKSLGGTDDAFNLLLLCPTHHGMLHGMKSRANISDLTREGLKKAKAKGTLLGFANPLMVLHQQHARENSKIALKKEADSFALHMKSVIRRMRNAGMSYRAIAEELNTQGSKTTRGGKWYASTVLNIVNRIQDIEHE